MRYPVNYINITNGYHFGLSLDFGWSSQHGGPNVPIYAIDDGEVISIQNQPNGGKTIYLLLNNGMVACYNHFSKIIVTKGQKVSLGEQIGNMGDTGKVSGPHCHLGIYSSKELAFKYGNTDIDPFELLEVYSNQIVADKTKEKYGNKIKYHSESANHRTTSELWLHSEPNFKEETNIALMNKDIEVEILGEKDGCYEINVHGYASKNYIK